MYLSIVKETVNHTEVLPETKFNRMLLTDVCMLILICTYVCTYIQYIKDR